MLVEGIDIKSPFEPDGSLLNEAPVRGLHFICCIDFDYHFDSFDL